MDIDPLKQAIELIRSGQKQDARKILEPLLKANPQNVPAWFWYAETCSTNVQRVRVLEVCYQFNPTNPQVKQALDVLQTQQPAGTPAPSPDQDRTSIDKIAANRSLFIQADTSSTSTELPEPAWASLEENDESSKVALVQEKPSELGGPSPEVEQAIDQTTSQKGIGRKSFGLIILAGSTIVICVVLAILAFISQPPDPADYRHDQPSEYYVYVPKAYTPNRTWLMFVGVHGSGQSGRDCWDLWQPYADAEGFILVCPSLADESGGWYQQEGEAKLFMIVEQVRQAYKIESRFFLAGFSAGGMFVQGVAFRYPQYVNGVAILSAGNYVSPTTSARGIPFLVVIGDQDDPMSIRGAELFTVTLQQNGFNVQYYLLPGVGHTVTKRGQDLTIQLFHQVK